VVSGLSDIAQPGPCVLQEKQAATTSKMLHTDSCSVRFYTACRYVFLYQNLFPKKPNGIRKIAHGPTVSLFCVTLSH